MDDKKGTRPVSRLDDLPEFAKVEDVARIIGVERKTLYNATIPGVRRVGRRVVIHVPTLANWFKS